MSPKEVEALEFAYRHHEGQLDKQGKPYILHVLRVAFDNVDGCTENVLISALLHDVVEDCGVSLSAINERFGKRIATAVDHLSRKQNVTYAQYIEQLKGDIIAVRVKIADLKDNLMASRIGTLDADEQRRLRRRYTKALAVLTEVREQKGKR